MNGTMFDCPQGIKLEVSVSTTSHYLLKRVKGSQHLTCAVCWHLTTAFFCYEMIGLITYCIWFAWTDNRVGDRGMKVLCEALKANTTLTKLNMECLLWIVLLRMAQMDEIDEW